MLENYKFINPKMRQIEINLLQQLSEIISLLLFRN